MWIKTAKLVNFRQHKNTSVEFGPHTNMIVGKVGAGKSNLMAAIKWCITGEFDKKIPHSVNINQLANDTERSFVMVEAIAEDGTPIFIERGLRPEYRKMTILGKTYTKASDISSEIYKHIELDNKAISSLIFVGQDEFRDIVSLRHSEFMKKMETLFGVDDLIDIYDKLGSWISSSKSKFYFINTDFIESEVNSLIEKENEIKAEIDKLKSENEWHENIVDDSANINFMFTAALHKISEAIKLFGDLNLKGILKSNNTDDCDFNKNSLELESLDKKLRELNESRFSLLSLSEEVRNTIKRMNSAKNLVKSSIDEINKYKLCTNDVKKPADYLEKDKRVDSVISICSDYLNMFIPKKGVEDVVSAISSSSVHDYRIESLELEIESKERFITSSTKSAIKDCLSEDTIPGLSLQEVLSKIDEIISNKKLELDGIESRLSELDREIKNTYAEYLSVREKLKSIKESESIKNMVLDVVFIVDKLSNSGVNIDKTYKTLTELKDILKKKHSEFAEYVGKISDLNRRLSVISSNLASSKRIYDDSVRRNQFASKSLKFISLVEKARDIFGRGSIPTKIVRDYMDKIKIEINDSLSAMGSEFHIDIMRDSESGIGFVAIFGDGRKIPLDMLSGGEKTIASFAFRIVINSLFAKKAGMLFIDEPTAGLPPNEIDKIRAAFDKIRDMAASRRMQIMMITHERSLGPLFDNIISLD